MTSLATSSLGPSARAVSALRASGITVVVWDMDHTMSGMHCSDGLPNAELPAYLAATSPDFVELSAALSAAGFRQAVATGSDPAEYDLPGHSRESHILGPDLATALIRTASGDDDGQEHGSSTDRGAPAGVGGRRTVLDSFEIMIGFDYRLHGKKPRDKGKRHHMRTIAAHYGPDVRMEEMLLIDDSRQSLVNEDGYLGCRVRDPAAGFRFSDLLVGDATESDDKGGGRGGGGGGGGSSGGDGGEEAAAGRALLRLFTRPAATEQKAQVVAAAASADAGGGEGSGGAGAATWDEEQGIWVGGAAAAGAVTAAALPDPLWVFGYVDEYLYNIQCSEIFTLRNEHLHTEA
jgi:hypothetical protein